MHIGFFETATSDDVQKYLNARVDPNARNERSATPLHVAAANSAIPAMVRVLINAGANLKARGKNGEAPFDLIPEDSLLRDTDVYWTLYEARFP